MSNKLRTSAEKLLPAVATIAALGGVAACSSNPENERSSDERGDSLTIQLGCATADIKSSVLQNAVTDAVAKLEEKIAEKKPAYSTFFRPNYNDTLAAASDLGPLDIGDAVKVCGSIIVDSESREYKDTVLSTEGTDIPNQGSYAQPYDIDGNGK